MSPVLGKCIAAVTKVTLADFQLFFPASVSTSSLLLDGGEREEIMVVFVFFFLSLMNADEHELNQTHI